MAGTSQEAQVQTLLSASPVACGYTVLLTAWERTLHAWFDFPNNHPYHCADCLYDVDAWTFEYK